MDAFQVSQAVRRAIQYTVATKITTLLEASVTDTKERAAVAGGFSILLVALRDETSGLPSTRVTADLALIVATNTLVQAVLADGQDSLPLTLAHLCCILEAGSALSSLALGDLADAFLGQVQYTFASSVSALLLTSFTATVALAAAGGLASLASWGPGIDSALATALSQAAFGVVKTLLLRSIPAGLQLPTIAGLLAFVKPLHTSLGVGSAIYSFALYQSGDAIQTAVETQLPPFVAAAASVAAAFVIPFESLQAAAKIAAVGSVTDWVVGLIQQAADQDPIPSLLALLVFCRIILAAFENSKQ
jgi:hypothetical protein